MFMTSPAATLRRLRVRCQRDERLAGVDADPHYQAEHGSVALSSAIPSWMANAARNARSGSSSCATGAPNRPTTASPMNFSTDPPTRSSSRRRRPWYGARRARTSSGSAGPPRPSNRRGRRRGRSRPSAPRAEQAPCRPCRDGRRMSHRRSHRALHARRMTRHLRSSTDPQLGQNRASGCTSAPHVGHVIAARMLSRTNPSEPMVAPHAPEPRKHWDRVGLDGGPPRRRRTSQLACRAALRPLRRRRLPGLRRHSARRVLRPPPRHGRAAAQLAAVARRLRTRGR